MYCHLVTKASRASLLAANLRTGLKPVFCRIWRGHLFGRRVSHGVDSVWDSCRQNPPTIATIWQSWLAVEEFALCLFEFLFRDMALLSQRHQAL